MSTRTVPEGEELVGFFEALEPGEGWLQAVGTVEGVELSVPRAGDEVRVAVGGRASLVSLAGPPCGPLFASVVRADAEGTKLVAGRLVKARSVGVWFALLGAPPEVVAVAAPSIGGSDAAGSRAAGPPTPDAPRSVEGPKGAVAAGPRSPAGVPGAAPLSGWAAAAEASANAEQADRDEAGEVPKYGDLVDHFVFGLCDVMVVKGERMKIRDVQGTGRLREIHVGAMRVLRPTERGGKRVFRLVRRG